MSPCSARTVANPSRAMTRPCTDAEACAAELKELLKTLREAEEIAFDLETTSLDERTAEIVGIALATNPPLGYWIDRIVVQN